MMTVGYGALVAEAVSGLSTGGEASITTVGDVWAGESTAGFERVLDLVDDASRGLLESLKR